MKKKRKKHFNLFKKEMSATPYCEYGVQFAALYGCRSLTPEEIKKQYPPTYLKKIRKQVKEKNNVLDGLGFANRKMGLIS